MGKLIYAANMSLDGPRDESGRSAGPYPAGRARVLERAQRRTGTRCTATHGESEGLEADDWLEGEPASAVRPDRNRRRSPLPPHPGVDGEARSSVSSTRTVSPGKQVADLSTGAAIAEARHGLVDVHAALCQSGGRREAGVTQAYESASVLTTDLRQRRGVRPPRCPTGVTLLWLSDRSADATDLYAQYVVRALVTLCQVDYAGNHRHLPMAPRLLVVKADGSVSVHADDKAYKPLN